MLTTFVILIVSAITFLRTINDFPLRNWDEAWYAEIIKNMDSGNYSLLVPFWNGQYYFDKPPLYFWLSLPFFEFFGPGEWQTRIVSAISAILATLLIYLVSKKLFDKTTGITAALIFLTLGQVVIRFAHGNLDALLVFLSLLTFYLYLISKYKLSLLILSGISLGLTYLAKGWILGLFPIFLLVTFEYWSNRKFSQILIVFLISLLTFFPYLLLGRINFGAQFLNWYLLNPSASLFLTSSFSLQFFENLARDIGIWFIPALIGLILNTRSKFGNKDKLISLILPSTTFIFAINFLSEKLGWYALPAYPFFAIILAYFCAKLLKTNPKTAVPIIIIALLTQIFNVVRIENIYPDRSTVGASLGQLAKHVIPQKDPIILDDHDFTAFLFYSNHKQVYVLEKNAKPHEWWIINPSDLPTFLKNHPHSWIVTPDINNLKTGTKPEHVKYRHQDYSFISL